MRTLQEKYNGVLEGKFSKTQFRRDAATELPQFVSNVNSFDDTVAILKNKGVVTEAKKEEKYFEAREVDNIAPDVLDTGIKFELDKKFDTLDVSKEDYEKAKETAVKNLTKDRAYYSKEVGEQLPTPGEKMEKAKLNEETDALFARNLKATDHDYGKMFNALGDAVATGEGLEDASAEELKIYAQIALRLGDDIDVINAFEYLENLPNYRPEFTPDNLRNKANEATSKEEAWKKFQEDNNITDKTVKVARADFEKEWAKRTDEAIQNIENDEQTKSRIAGLVNDFLQKYKDIPEVGAYAAQVKNKLKAGDTSTLKKYKSIMDEKALIADLEKKMGIDLGNAIEKAEYEAGWNADDLSGLEENLDPSDIQDLLDDVGRLERGEIDVKVILTNHAAHRDKDELTNFFKDLELAEKHPARANIHISRAAGEIEKLDPRLKKEVNEDETLDKVQVLITPPGSKPFLALDGKEMSDEEADKFIERSKNVRGETKAEKVKPGHKYYGPKGALLGKPIKEEREALKEMFKKIIAKVIND